MKSFIEIVLKGTTNISLLDSNKLFLQQSTWKANKAEMSK